MGVLFGSWGEARRMEILETFHTIKEQYRQIFLISHEMEIKEMFERVVELLILIHNYINFKDLNEK